MSYTETLSARNTASETVKDATPESTTESLPPIPPAAESNPLRARMEDFSFFYADGTQAIKNVSMPILDRHVTAIIGPSGCGKSTLLRSLNRMHDLYPGNRYQGKIVLEPEEENLIGDDSDPVLVRLRVGMVFQKPNPFPKSIYENVAAGLRVRGIKNSSVIDEAVEQALRRSAIWDEVKDKLHGSAYELSGGQQQRLCIARALAPNPEILLLDEPTSALDPIATAKVEDLVQELSETVTVVIVTHNMQQAARISHRTAFMYLGELIEFGVTDNIFTNPQHPGTESYITGRYG
ncbi:phosphate ABC transporter ATP-binding protein PstB [Spiribacter vilamensis]|uniref:Phosphate ABC transporter ATP-binding protein (PhoT family) n=1 Tax=Spiribacter vilamensis TaxID=531306 RepID=A0A4Q8CYA7_9GAMM|nr:phosphate ABC transporter ATP-binding protein PstB [Spiribacter vilamensis]RZU97958.1 phosphate ABC transporter ATP-binding protein (PhoT family) [Spiribacter vilamensis]TVO61129.1 phosphate ABC transporter ATP-binding protein [Spiribacter vilamensis]